MGTALLVGLVVGWVLAMPPGPLAIVILRRALTGHAREGVALALGVSTMDIVYALLVGWASSALFQSLQSTVTDHAGVLLVVQVGWIVGLAVVGLRYLRAAPRGVVVGARPETQEEPTRTRGSSSPYLRGVLLALSNLVSPTFVPSLIFLMGVVQARGWVGHEVGEHILYAVGFGTGTALWFVLLLRTLTPLRARLSPQVLPLLSRVAGGALLLCAIVLTSHIVTATPWSRLPGWSWQHGGW